MFIATLLSHPAKAGLEIATVQSLRNAWGGGAIRWLNPGIAAEFPLETKPSNLWKVWANLQEISVDLAVQPAAGRKRQLLLADMDSTMIEQECIDELVAVAGVGHKVAAITAQAMDGGLEFEQSLRARVALLAGQPADIIKNVLARQISYAPGGGILIATLRAHGCYTALVSGGFTAFSGPVAQHLGFDEHRANLLLLENGMLTGQVAEPILGRAAKIDALSDICTRLGLNHDDAMTVGDGANDLGMLGAAGAGVALHAKPSVARQCSLRINHGDLTALLYLQGYSADEFQHPCTGIRP